MKNIFFITGTDTDIGKTYTTVALLKHFSQLGLKTAALKPIASDAQHTEGGLRNIDALKLQSAMSMSFPYKHINPYTFAPAISPHIAAEPNQLNIGNILKQCQPVLNSDYDILFIEGAGGWLAPLNEKETFADLAAAFQAPIILVVGMKLGCLNHSRLTWENIQLKKRPFAGWVANHLDPNMLNQTENRTTLESLMGPPLAVIPYRGELTEMRLRYTEKA